MLHMHICIWCKNHFIFFTFYLWPSPSFWSLSTLSCKSLTSVQSWDSPVDCDELSVVSSVVWSPRTKVVPWRLKNSWRVYTHRSSIWYHIALPKFPSLAVTLWFLILQCFMVKITGKVTVKQGGTHFKGRRVRLPIIIGLVHCYWSAIEKSRYCQNCSFDIIFFYEWIICEGVPLRVMF